MSLVSLALVGKRGEPLFVQEFKSAARAAAAALSSSAEDEAYYDDDGGGGPSEHLDLFGLDDDDDNAADIGDGGPTTPYDCSLTHQFVLHSALDRFDEVTAPGVRPSPPASAGAGASASDAMWLGLLCPVDDLKVYGYVTSTKVRILAAVEDAFLPDETQRQKAREVDVKTLFANVHALYVEHTLNPFAAPGTETRIDSRRFHDGVRRLVETFNGVAGGMAVA